MNLKIQNKNGLPLKVINPLFVLFSWICEKMKEPFVWTGLLNINKHFKQAWTSVLRHRWYFLYQQPRIIQEKPGNVRGGWHYARRAWNVLQMERNWATRQGDTRRLDNSFNGVNWQEMLFSRNQRVSCRHSTTHSTHSLLHGSIWILFKTVLSTVITQWSIPNNLLCNTGLKTI
jgi:hypothetical protein